MSGFRSEWLSRYDHGNKIILDPPNRHGIDGGFQKTLEAPSSSPDAKANDPCGIFRFVIHDEQMVLIIIALGLLAPALKDAKDNLNRFSAQVYVKVRHT